MKTFNKIPAVVLIVVLALGVIGPTPVSAATTPSLGAAATFGVLAGTYTNTTVTTIFGDVGYTTGPATAPTMGSGTIYGPSEPTPTARTDAASALTTLNAETCTENLGAIVNLSTVAGHTTGVYTPGVYCSTGAMSIGTGGITLSGAGTYIFRAVGALTSVDNSVVTLTNGASSCDAFWTPTAATTLGANTTFVGTIIDNANAITLGANTIVTGRLLSLGAGTVTTDTNTINRTCVIAAAAASAGGQVSVSYAQLPLPLINVTKVPDPLALPSGPGPVTYTYTATNVGQVAMHSVSVTDNKCSTVTFIAGDSNNNSLLDMDEAWVYRCTKTVSLTETNTATAYGAANNGAVWDTANATVVVGLNLPPPLIHLKKVPSVFALPVGGGPVTYTYTVTNPGTEPLSKVSVIDDKCTGLPGQVVGHPGDLNQNNLLESNETWTFTCQTNIWQTTTNIGTAEGSANGLTAIDFSPATVVVAVPSFPSTALGSDENNLPWAVAVLAGTFAISALLYFTRKKHLES